MYLHFVPTPKTEGSAAESLVWKKHCLKHIPANFPATKLKLGQERRETQSLVGTWAHSTLCSLSLPGLHVKIWTLFPRMLPSRLHYTQVEYYCWLTQITNSGGLVLLQLDCCVSVTGIIIACHIWKFHKCRNCRSVQLARISVCFLLIKTFSHCKLYFSIP